MRLEMEQPSVIRWAGTRRNVQVYALRDEVTRPMLLDRWTLTLLIAVQLGRLLQSPPFIVSALTLLAVLRVHCALRPHTLSALVRAECEGV